MGTTLVMGIYQENSLLVTHVGDSRAYLIRKKKIKSLTRDHSVVEAMLEKGMISKNNARHHQLRHVITNVIGTEKDPIPDVAVFPVEPEDRLLLCSDGLTEMLEDQEIEDIVNDGKDEGLICAALIEKANQKGGYDNITIVLVQIT
jgi:protein phosphatase